MTIDIQKLWMSYCEDVIPNAGIMERKVAKKAFFAGAGVVNAIYHVADGVQGVGEALRDVRDLEARARQGKLALVVDRGVKKD